MVVQSYNPGHYSITYAATHDYEGFATKELGYRKQLNYPPFGKLARIVFRGPHEDKTKENSSLVANKLKEIARICRWVPENPPRTFHEALQSIAIVGVCKNFEHPMHYHPHLARIDDYLWPYFEQDVKGGRIDVDKAAELLEELSSRRRFTGRAPGAAAARPRATG